MLPLWNYLCIAFIGYFSTDNRWDRFVCIFYFIYVVYLYITFNTLSHSLYLYLLSRLLLPVIGLISIIFIKTTLKTKVKLSLCLGFTLLVDSLLFYGVFFNSLEVLGLSLELSVYVFEVLTLILGFVEWRTVKQALLGSSIGFFYVIHFIG